MKFSGMLSLTVFLTLYTLQGCTGGDVGTETENSFSGVIIDSQGPVVGALVTLYPGDFNPLQENLPAEHQTVTDDKGKYLFKISTPGSYNIQAIDPAEETMGIELGVNLPENGQNQISVPDIELKDPAEISIPLGELTVDENGMIYITGTGIIHALTAKEIEVGSVVVKLPAGEFTELSYSDAANRSFIVAESVVAISGKTTLLPIYPKWSHRFEIVLNTSETGAFIQDDVTNFPLLVRLEGSAHAQALMGDGSDLRFSKADEITPLPFEIEYWSAGAATIWVGIDTIFGNSSTQHIFMYTGKGEATGKSTGARVFSEENGFAGAWHLNDASQIVNSKDTSQLGDNTGVENTSGVINGGVHFPPSSLITLPPEIFTKISDELTISLWFIAEDSLPSRTSVFDARRGAPDDRIRILAAHIPWTRNIGGQREDKVFFYAGDSGIAADSTLTTDVISKLIDSTQYRDNWYHWTFTKNVTTGEMKIYLNGDLWQLGEGKTFPMGPIGIFALGSLDEFGGESGGYLDEFRVSHVERDSAWVKLNFECQKPEAEWVSIKYSDP